MKHERKGLINYWEERKYTENKYQSDEKVYLKYNKYNINMEQSCCGDGNLSVNAAENKHLCWTRSSHNWF